MCEVKQIGNIFQDAKSNNPQGYRVYNQCGLSPTLTSDSGGYRVPLIVEKKYV